MNKAGKITLRVFKWLGYFLLGLILLLLVIIILLRTEWAQEKIVNYATSYISDKTGTVVEIGSLYITFDGNIYAEDFYLEDQKKDTLLFGKELETGIGISALINGNIAITELDLDGVTANIVQHKDSTFNFSFLLNAFSPSDSSASSKNNSDSSSAPDFSLGPVELTDIKLNYLDSLFMFDLNVDLKHLQAEPGRIDLNAYYFAAEDLMINGLKSSIHQFAKPPPPSDSTSVPMPYLEYGDIKLNNISVNYYTSPDTLQLTANINHFSSSEGTLDLVKQDISIEAVELMQSDIFVKIPAAHSDSQSGENGSSELPWPDWKVKLQDLRMANNEFTIIQGRPRAADNTFDPTYIGLNDLDLGIHNISFAHKKVSLDIDSLNFTERSGLIIKNLQGTAALDSNGITIDKLTLKTNNSHIHANAAVSYSSLENFLADPTDFMEMQMNISNSKLVLSDAYFFNDSLRYQEFVQKTDQYPLHLDLKAEGDMGHITIDHLKANWLNSTRLNAYGTISGLPDTNNIRVNFPQLDLYSTRTDMAMILNQQDASSLPEYVKINSELRGGTDLLKAQVNAITPQGNLSLNASAENLLNTPSYQGKLVAENFNLGAFTNTPELDSVSLSMNFNGRGMEPSTMDLQTIVNIKSLTYNNYDYSALKLNADIKNGEAQVVASHNDENLDFLLTANASLDSNYIAATFDLKLEGADLHDLNFTARKIKIGTNLQGGYSGTSKNFQSRLNVSRAIIQRNDRSYRVDTIYATLDNSYNKTFLQVQSPIISGDLQSNHSLQTTYKALQDYLNRAVDNDSLMLDTTFQNLIVDADFTVNNSPLLENVLTPKLEQLDSITIDFVFEPSKNLFKLEAISPMIIYANAELKNLNAKFTADDDSLIAHIGFDHFFYNSIQVHQTDIDAEITNGSGYARAQILDQQDKEIFYTSLNFSGTSDYTRLEIDPQHLVLNGNPWQIPADNFIQIEDGKYQFNQFLLNREQQEVQIDELNNGRDVQFQFKNFRLASIFSILNPEESPVKGALHGQLKLLDLDISPAFIADLEIREMVVLENPVGNLTLEASSGERDVYEVDMSLRGDSIILHLAGDYRAGGNSPTVDMNLNITRLHAGLVQGFIPEILTKSQGYLTGNLMIGGPVNDIIYNGKLTFIDVETTPKMLGTEFRLNRDILRISEQGIHFDNFTIQDADGSITSIVGQIGTENYLNPTFDLQVRSNNFRFLNSKEINNKTYYGEAILDIDLSINGDLNLPVVDARVKLLEGSEITYAVPLAQAKMEERRGIVRFRNMKDSTDVFASEEEASAVVNGIDLNARIILDPTTIFHIIIDPETGDVLTVQGESQLQLNIYPNGEVRLVGNYDLSDGSYELSLYDLVQKKFDILEGSNVRWTGDPMEAILDITAVYKLDAPPTDLMADRLAGADAATLNRYKQEVPFEVMLYIDGTIAEPKISFGLEMPDNSKNVMGGSVYSRVQQLNETESELNKQVFSLVVFNRFLPSNVAADDGGGTSALARSSVSKLLSNQLNKLSEKYISGIELNFDVDSYTDYQTGAAQQRTDLNISLKKTFADGRVIVQVGSQVGLEGQPQRNSIIGDVQAEYLITENGTYRAQVFRKNQFQDIIEGQIIITGLALIFNKEFDNWEELWKKQPKKEEPLVPEIPEPVNEDAVKEEDANAKNESGQ